MNSLNSKLATLKDILRGLENALVAYSGGVDSVFLLKVASQCLPNRVIAVTAISPSYPTYELNAASELAREMGVEHITVKTHELEDERYRANTGDRCYFCKSELYTVCGDLAREKKIQWILNGVNVDDLGDYRPGLKAAEENQVRSPLVEAGLTKNEIRILSKELGLPTWDKQALACLSSRFPPGTEVTEEKLGKIDRIETKLVQLGFKNFRVRFHEPIARIEVGPEDFGKFMQDSIRAEVNKICRENGFLYAALDLAGYQMGNLNQMLPSLPSLPSRH